MTVAEAAMEEIRRQLFSVGGPISYSQQVILFRRLDASEEARLKAEAEVARCHSLAEYAASAPTFEQCKIILVDIVSGLPIRGANDLHLRKDPAWIETAKRLGVELNG